MPELPDDLISLSSLDGANLAAAQPAAAPMWSLLAHFETQHTQSFCSIATAAMLLNVLGVPRPIDPAYAPYPYFTQANVLGECALARPVTPNKNRAGGENISVATQPHPKSQTPTPTPTLARIHAADALTRRSHSSAHMARRWPSGAITSPAGRTRPSSTPQRAASRTSARVNPNPNPNPSPSPSKVPSRSPSRSTSKSKGRLVEHDGVWGSLPSKFPSTSSELLSPPPALSKPAFRRSSTGDLVPPLVPTPVPPSEPRPGGFGSSPGSDAPGIGPVHAQQTAVPSMRRDEEQQEEPEQR